MDYPKKGEKVIVLLERGDDGKYQIPDAIIKFFPKRWFMPIVEVTGFDDPQVTETIENLRKLRGRQREEAEKAKAEKASADAEKAKAEQKSVADKSAGPKNAPPEKSSLPQIPPAK